MRIGVISEKGDILGLCNRMREEGHVINTYVKNKWPGLVSDLPLVDSWRPLLLDHELFIFDSPEWGQNESLLMERNKAFFGCNAACSLSYEAPQKKFDLLKSLDVPLVETHIVNGEDVFEPSDGQFTISGVALSGLINPIVTSDKQTLDWAMNLAHADKKTIVIQRNMGGVHASVEGFFNGRDWIYPLYVFVSRCGTIDSFISAVGMAVRNVDAKITSAIRKLTKPLRRFGYRGYASMPLVVSSTGQIMVKDINFKISFGSIEAVLEGCKSDVSDILFGVSVGTLETLEASWDLLASIQLSALPHQCLIGAPILGLNEENKKHVWLVDVAKTSVGGRMFTIGRITARGRGSKELLNRIYRTVGNIRYPGKLVDYGAIGASSDLQRIMETGVI